jgi:DNA modification methylase
MAKKNNRNYIGIEISPEYVDLINSSLDWVKNDSATGTVQ